MSESNSVECSSVELTLYKRNRGVILNRAKDYYANDKERLTRGRRREWTVDSTSINIREYFKNGLQHGFEIFGLLTFIIWGHSLKISDSYLYFFGN